jgi:hypothetical protein
MTLRVTNQLQISRSDIGEPMIFTKERAEAAKGRLVRRFLNRSAGPHDPLEENLVISDLADYMGYLFEMGYQDYDSNCGKLMEDLRAAVSEHLDNIRLKREKERERKMAIMMETLSHEAGRIN